MQKPLTRILIGIAVFVAIMFNLFYFFLFMNPLNIHESNNLKWIPILIISISMYVSGVITKRIAPKWLPLLFIPIVLLKPFNYFYFPFILIILIIAILMIVVSRVKTNKYKYLSLATTSLIFISYLFSQPLIFEKKGFGYDKSGLLINATTFWDFSSNDKNKLPDHILRDLKDNEINFNSLKGKTHFIAFWATWCAPCLEVKPELENLKNQLKPNQSIAFVDISFDNNTQIWHQYIQEKNTTGKQLYTENSQLLSRQLGFQGIPIYMIVDSEGYYKSYRSFKVAKNILLKKKLED